ncbi:hypothetical protein SLS61_008347 [Didymella pomorum]
MAEDSSAPPLAQADKAQAPATFSSFINKNTSGKKFAPKAARRRPAAAAKPAPAASTAESQQPEPESSNAPAEPSITAPLPTPASTQPATQPAEPPAPQPLPESTPATAPQPAPVSTPAVEAPQPPPESRHAPRPSSQQVDVPLSVEHDIDAGRSPKRRRIESPSRQSTPMVPIAVMVPPQDAQTGEIIPQQPAPPAETAETLSVPSAELGEPIASTGASPATEAEGPAQSKRRRRALPWTAVNHPQEEGGEASGVADPPAKKKRAPPKPRGKKKAAEGAEDGEPQEDGDGEEAEPTQNRPSARARGKRRAAEPEIGEDGQPVEPPPKKPRRARKDKGKQPAVEGETAEGEGGEEGDAAPKPKPEPKPRAPKRKKSTPAEGAEGEEGSVEPKKRGRPPREDTPPDAEDHVIDPDTMCMDDLASRNIRVGKLSRREREMRKIDWDAVKQRRREEDARHITTKEAQAAVDKLLETGDVEQVSTGPRYHVVDGRIELVQDSGTIDRERDADREIEMMTITEEDDLTTRITSRSFMKNNKRFPNEFVLPGQGKRWNAQSTEMFYQGLRSFGTDFQMIAHMFPGMTRRSIKTKFTREERENPNLVRDCLRGESTLASHWGEFLEASQRQDDSFADSDRIKKDLEEEEARMREQIDAALKEKEEREHQKRLAGVTEDGEAGEKENAKGKKKRKTKDKNVTFQEEGVEILGEVDDDPNWGQE